MLGLLRRRPIVAASVLGVGLIVVLSVAVWLVSRTHCFALVGPVVCRVETAAPRVALTFDDGPTDRGVDYVLPLLERHGARATFFVIGEEMVKRPHLAPRLARAGHELANHSFTHEIMIGRPSSFYDREIVETERLLSAAAGRSSGYFRAPYSKKLLGLPLAVRRHGLLIVGADVMDPRAAHPAEFARQVVAKARPGSIILLHVMYGPNRRNREALPLILEGLEAKGLTVGTVSELMASGRSAGP